jgi:HEAT repeat protein
MKNYLYLLVVAGLAVYVGALGVLTADNVLHLGLFPPKLDRILAADIAKLGSADEKKRVAAQGAIVAYHEFSIPPLIRAMERGDAQQKERCADCLRQIAKKYFLSEAKCGTDAAAWSQWWRIEQAIDGLRDERPSAQENAKAEIVRHGRAAVPVLIDTLRDPNKAVRVRAADTLAQLTGANEGLEADKWLAWWKTQEGKKQ